MKKPFDVAKVQTPPASQVKPMFRSVHVRFALPLALTFVPCVKRHRPDWHDSALLQLMLTSMACRNGDHNDVELFSYVWHCVIAKCSRIYCSSLLHRPIPGRFCGLPVLVIHYVLARGCGNCQCRRRRLGKSRCAPRPVHAKCAMEKVGCCL